MIHQLANALVVGVLALTGGTALATADETDQDHVADAIAASSIRVLRAGFWSVGPGTRDSDFVSSCLGGMDSPGRLAPFPGETARAVSNVYLYQPDADIAPDEGELLTAAIIAVDGANESSLDWFVFMLGQTDTAECRRDEYLSNPAATAESADGAPTIEVTATPGLGIADESSRLDMDIVFSVASVQHRVAYSFLVARTGRILVVMRVATFGDGPFSGVDAETELAAIVESLNTP